MSADHRRPLFAFFVVAAVCALLVGQGVRSDSFLDFIVGRSASPATVAESVTLKPLPAAPAGPADRPAAPKDDSATSPSGSVGTATSTGGGRSDEQNRSGRSAGRGLPAPQASDHAQGAGKPSRAADRRPGPGHGKAHVSGARAGALDSGHGKAKGLGRTHGKAKGQGNGHGKGAVKSQGHRPRH